MLMVWIFILKTLNSYTTFSTVLQYHMIEVDPMIYTYFSNYLTFSFSFQNVKLTKTEKTNIKIVTSMR